MRPHGSAERLEERRRKAVALTEQGWGPTGIARLLDTTPQSVGRWMRTYQEGGSEALTARPTPGRPPKLNARRRRVLDDFGKESLKPGFFDRAGKAVLIKAAGQLGNIVTTPGTLKPWFMLKVSMIQAMTLAFVLTSGAGMSRSGPMIGRISLV